MKVRVATQEDLYDIMPLIKKFWKEGQYADMEYDSKFIADQYTNYMNTPNCKAFVVEREGELVGMLMGIIMPQAFSSNPAAYEIAWFVSPEARGTSAALRLVKAYEEWAIAEGCSFLNMSRIEGVENDKVHSMYTKLGLTLKEHTYIKELK